MDRVGQALDQGAGLGNHLDPDRLRRDDPVLDAALRLAGGVADSRRDRDPRAPASCSRPMSVAGHPQLERGRPLGVGAEPERLDAPGARSAVSSATVTAPPVTGLPKT